MALKDLIISKEKISEELLEKILKDKIQLVEGNEEIFLLPGARQQPLGIKILLYLCGKKAWSLINNKTVLTPIVEMSNNLGVKSNTIRPKLKELRDQKLVESKKGQYSIFPIGIYHLQEYISGKIKTASVTRPKKTKKKGIKNKPGKGSVKKTVKTGLSDQLTRMLQEGFFNDAKSLSETQSELRKRAFNIPITTIPSYILKMVRKRDLERYKEKKEGRTIWVYQVIKTTDEKQKLQSKS